MNALLRSCLLVCATESVAILLAAVAQAQHPEDSSILRWTPDEQLVGFREIESHYRVGAVQTGASVSPLPRSEKEIDPTFIFKGKQETVQSYMELMHVSGLLVIKDGNILLERYAFGRQPSDRWISFSITKSITSTLLGAALKDGFIRSLDERVVRYIPELDGSAYDRVTIRDLATMRSGVAWSEDYADPNSDVSRAGSNAADPGSTPIVSYMRRLATDGSPGGTFRYSTGDADLMGIVISRAVGEPLRTYLSRKIWAPAGMERDAVWMQVDPDAERGGCCLAMTLKDLGRFGMFVMNGGKGSASDIGLGDWFAEALSPQVQLNQPFPLAAGYGYMWWVRDASMVEALGAFGQSLTLIPSEGLVIAINSALSPAAQQGALDRRMALIAAIRREAANAPSPSR